MNWISYWLSSKTLLVRRFKAAKLRVAEQTDDVRKLPQARIVSATEELTQIVKDVRTASEQSPPAIPTPDPGKPKGRE